MDVTHSHLHDDHEHHHHDEHEHHDHRKERAVLWAKAALLVGLTLYFVWIIVTGNWTNYINERFAWLTFVAAAVFGLLAIYTLITAIRANDEAYLHELAHAHDHGDHTHEKLSWGALAIIAVPLVLGTLIPSRPLGAEAINGELSTTAAVGELTTFTVNPLDRNVLDWLRYFGSVDDYSDVDGQRADVIGFVYKEPTFGDDHFMVARFTVSCCVADASAIGLPVLYADSAAMEQGAWVRVQGTFSVGEFRGDLLPILNVDSIEMVQQPEHPYLYP
jgi:uncharacterized repeat protein (TIGR03943 family)